MNFWRIDELKGGLNKILEASSKKRLTFFFRFTCFKGECVGRTVHSPTCSAGNSRNPGMSWCDKGQISIFIPGGVRRSPLETSIFQRSPWNPSGLFPLSKSTGLWRNPVSGGVQRTPAESSGIQWNIRNPAESSGLQQSLFIASLFNY